MNTSSLPVPQNIIVTGGGRGLGYEMAQALVEAGHRVLITGTRASQELQSAAAHLQQLAGTLRSGQGEQAFAMQADVAREQPKIGALARRIEEVRP
jgi:NAD(P)-dependent dehydrogenase (short-subunit alcohol dehydrogenase family)